MTVYDGDCLDGPEGCEGETFPRPALSGSGDSYSRCARHDALYVERVQPMMDEINRRYPAMAPADFDPYCAGSFDCSGVLQTAGACSRGMNCCLQTCDVLAVDVGRTSTARSSQVTDFGELRLGGD